MVSVAVIVGSSQGIGLQLARIYLSQTNLHVVALSRDSEKAKKAILDTSSKLPFLAIKDKDAGHVSDDVYKQAGSDSFDESRLTTISTDVKKEESIANASEEVKKAFGKDSVRLLLNVAGMLHPEKSLAQVDYDEMIAQFQLNTFAPFLSLKHFTPLMQSLKTLKEGDDQSKGLLPSQMNVIASLSARVGSISDNQLGGWYSYRASKAAQNAITRSFSLDLARNKTPSICVGLHPGTVRTELSKEFTGGPRDESEQAKEDTSKRRQKGQFEASESASLLAGLISRFGSQDSGYVWDYAGKKIPY